MLKSMSFLKFVGLLLLMLFIVFPANAATYTYDVLGRLTSVTYNNGKKINYTYDAGGNLLTVTMPNTVAPRVYSTDPADGATGVPVGKTVYVTFSEEVQPGDNYGGIMLKAGDTVVATNYNISGSVLTIDPVNALDYSTAYAVYIPAGAVKDTAGNALAADCISTFITEAAPVTIIQAIINCDPDVLNPKSKGKWVTVYIQLPAGYDVGKIDIGTVKLNGQVPAETDLKYGFVKNPDIADRDGDGLPELMVKFDRAAVQQILSPGEAEVTISGKVLSGGILADFEGMDTIILKK